MSNLGRFYVWRFEEAEEKFANDAEVEECYAICRELLLSPDLPIGLRAGAHTMLSCSDNYLYHARQAVYYCEQIVLREPENADYQETLEERRASLRAAEAQYDIVQARQAPEAAETSQQAAAEDAGQGSAQGAPEVAGDVPEDVLEDVPEDVPEDIAGENAGQEWEIYVQQIQSVRLKQLEVSRELEAQNDVFTLEILDTLQQRQAIVPDARSSDSGD